MKSPKRIAALLLAGFLAFAPPGTLIFLFALLIGLVGRRWAWPLATLCLGAGAVFLLILRRRRRRARLRADDSVKLEEH
jgi:membrane protein implicated in regulation of membrane protease activity